MRKLYPEVQTAARAEQPTPRTRQHPAQPRAAQRRPAPRAALAEQNQQRISVVEKSYQRDMHGAKDKQEKRKRRKRIYGKRKLNLHCL